RRFRNIGKVQLVVITGIFIKNEESRVDILIVGDGLKKQSIESVLRTMEAELGKEIRYALLETKEFSYRMNVYDKFIRDILDYPHRKIINKLGIA
ncbi:hypothetical protein L0Y49_01805, partial [bacterium]|nr:hypothetical protein [bacterium]